VQEPHPSHDGSPWHEGERAAQRLAGVAERMEALGKRVIRSFMPDQHRSFFESLPFVVVGSVDEEGWAWASLLSGEPGFVRSPDAVTLDIRARPAAGDPLAHSVRAGARLGMLGIELATRRRNRVNGEVIRAAAEGFSLHVDQSFGNCPKYIHPRQAAGPALGSGASNASESFTRLDGRARALISSADTFFVASHAPAREARPESADVSHRGGPRGFLRFDADGSIIVPDYPGNLFFNTLGNLMLDPRAGLLFADFDRGDLLQVTGVTAIAWQEQLWRFKPAHGRWLNGALPIRFTPVSL